MLFDGDRRPDGLSVSVVSVELSVMAADVWHETTVLNHTGTVERNRFGCYAPLGPGATVTTRQDNSGVSAGDVSGKGGAINLIITELEPVVKFTTLLRSRLFADRCLRRGRQCPDRAG
jgi:hypothetical protein